MIYDNEMKIEFLSRSENEGFARVAVSSFISQLDPNIEEISDIKTAVSEAVTNSIIHGYENKIGIIKIIVMIKEKTVFLEISDEGKGIENITKARQALFTSKPALERSGLGFTIMESFMDNVEIISRPNKGTTIKMKKELGKRNKKITQKQMCVGYGAHDIP